MKIKINVALVAHLSRPLSVLGFAGIFKEIKLHGSDESWSYRGSNWGPPAPKAAHKLTN